MKHQPVPYTTYIYLTRVDTSGNPEIYSLHVMLWMPKNYRLETTDNKNPEGIHLPEIFYHRLILMDAEPDTEDNLTACVPITWSVENFEKPKDKDMLEVYYEVSNQTRNKIAKKPKSKVAYIHADIGGAAPAPPDPDTTEVASLI
jgi:hypothetical protein